MSFVLAVDLYANVHWYASTNFATINIFLRSNENIDYGTSITKHYTQLRANKF